MNLMDNGTTQRLVGVLQASLSASQASSTRSATYTISDKVNQTDPAFSIRFTFCNSYLLSEMRLNEDDKMVAYDFATAVTAGDFADLDFTNPQLASVLLANTTALGLPETVKLGFDTDVMDADLGVAAFSISNELQPYYDALSDRLSQLTSNGEITNKHQLAESIKNYCQAKGVPLTYADFKLLSNMGKVFSVPATLLYHGLSNLHELLEARGLLESLMDPMEVASRRLASEQRTKFEQMTPEQQKEALKRAHID